MDRPEVSAAVGVDLDLGSPDRWSRTLSWSVRRPCPWVLSRTTTLTAGTRRRGGPSASTEQTLLFIPLAVQEMVLAVWMIARSFRPAAASVVCQRPL